MSSKRQRLDRKKKKKQQRRKQERITTPLSLKQRERLLLAGDLIVSGDYKRAEELLLQLDERTNNAEVVRAFVALYQRMNDCEKWCATAERLVELSPFSADALMAFAQGSLFCGRAAIALRKHQEFVERWPDHQYAPKAKEYIERLVEEVELRIKVNQFPPESAFQCCYLHEESIALLFQGKYEECAAKCEELIALAPNFVQARNNLALAFTYSDRMQEAVAVLEETRRWFPDCHFTQGSLSKLYFLTGRADDAHQLADQFVKNPPSDSDAIGVVLEALTFLGRDEDVVRIAESAAGKAASKERSEAFRLHFLAYAKCRLGDIKAAKKIWNRCLKLPIHIQEARDNLKDLEAGTGHAPWGREFNRWISAQTLNDIAESGRGGKTFTLANFPVVASLIPALLDRGDPLGRSTALQLAKADKSPPMIEALKDFVFGSRGPDSQRLEALRFLFVNKFIGTEVHRIFKGGNWINVRLFSPEITYEPLPSKSSRRVQDLLAIGYEAMLDDDFATAEQVFTEAVAAEPDNTTAVYNLCTVWLQRDGEEGRRKACPRLEQLHKEHPDYLFAAIAIAQFAAMDGDYQRAGAMLAPFYNATKLHISEAKALLGANLQIALAQQNLELAEQLYATLCGITEPDDPHVQDLRDLIDSASCKSRWKSFFSRG